jgi:hypothetical protein
MWIFFTILMTVWLILKFVLHKGGYIHIVLIAAITVFVVQVITDRKTRYHKTPAA